MASKWVTATVIENKQLSERHYVLKIESNLLPFEAGQFARLQVNIENENGESESFAKPYSLINAPNDRIAEIYFNTVPDGKVSNQLAALQPGDQLEISQPCLGFFVLSQIPESKHLWLLSTGTGVGPYLSMLQTEEIWQRFEKIVLVHAVPLKKELCYHETLLAFETKHPDIFQYIPVVSRENHSDILKGRIPDLIENNQLEQKAQLTISTETSHVMLCGNTGMLKDAKAVLKKRGMNRHLNHDPGHVSSESYF